MNEISNLLGWLAGAAAVPRWAVVGGAFCALCVMGSAAFLVWFGWLTHRIEAEDEHD